MRYNKTLGVAVAAILSGGVGLAANAGELGFSTDGSVAQTSFSPQLEFVESEDIKDDGSSGSTPSELTTVIEFKRNANMTFNVYIDYTLSGAKFKTEDLTALGNPSILNVGDTDSANSAAITLIKIGDNLDTVRYMIQGQKKNVRTNPALGNAFDPASKEDLLVFTFTPDETIGLVANGGSVKLSAEWGEARVDFKVEDSANQTLLQSKAGISATFEPKKIPSQIDVTKGGQKFAGGYSETAITLGTVIINHETSPGYDIEGNTVDGSLIVSKGPFDASGENQVFLDLDTSDGDCVFTADVDVAAIVDGEDAVFELTDTNVDAMVGTARDVCVTVSEDNVVNINDTKERASAALTLSYPSDKKITYVGRLAQTERNGTECTLYNVPHKQGSDIGFYRFINRTDKDVIVWGTLKDRDGIEYFKNEELGELKANGTLVVNSNALHDYATAAGAAAESPWGGRAILTVNSNSTNMEAYGLLRGKNTKKVLLGGSVTPNIGPLINVSAGASGNGCD